MKKMAIALLFCSFFLINNGNGQLRTAIAGGVHIASVPGNNSPQWDTLNYKYSSRRGFHVGLLADVPFFNSRNFYLQTGMFYTNKGRNFTSTLDTTTGISKVSSSQFVNYMEIPFNFVYKIHTGKKSKIILGGGPSASFLFTGKESTNTYYTNGTINSTENTSMKIPRSQGKYRNLDFGVNALLGMEFGRLFLTANYSQGITEFYQTNNLTGSFKHKVMGATLGFFLNKEKTREPKRETKPRDRDRDGVPDKEDECPREKGTAKGCPDKDGDGIPDKDDSCPTFAGSPKRNGCPAPDTDKDGINDDDDKCPTDKGVKDNNGCPEINKELKSKLESYAKRIQFKYKSAVLSTKSKTVLDGIVKILKENPELNVFIEGYTSNDGNPRNHIRLSQTRAESVKEYLELSGIKSKRLKATGFGDANPLNKNKTEADRAINRRVELKITNH